MCIYFIFTDLFNSNHYVCVCVCHWGQMLSGVVKATVVFKCNYTLESNTRTEILTPLKWPQPSQRYLFISHQCDLQDKRHKQPHLLKDFILCLSVWDHCMYITKVISHVSSILSQNAYNFQSKQWCPA